ncbi:MAG: hypothetical protein AAF619_11490 [Pseudomonadota bacterium]
MDSVTDAMRLAAAYYDDIPTSVLMLGLFVAMIAGYFLDDILGNLASGTFINGFIIMFGGVVGMIGLGFAGFDLREDLLPMFAAFASSGAVIFTTYCFVKSRA